MPEEACVRIETPRGSFFKRDGRGRVDFVSPFPSPFNYGSVPGTLGADGEALDAVVLGPRLPRGHLATHTLRGRVRFLDGGVSDDKLICGPAPSPGQRRRVVTFFRVYAAIKATRPWISGPSRLLGVEWFEVA